MNNKGFAITAVIYGLAILGVMIIAILMGTLSSTRNNVAEEAEAVENFLINFNQTEITYRKTGIYTIPPGETGWYRFEAFGKNSGSARGAYVTGIIFAKEGTKFRITIDNNQTFVQYINPSGSDTNLMRAQAAQGSVPGGTLLCYNSSPLGGDVDMTSFELKDPTKSFTGVDGVTYNNCPDLANQYRTYLLGYPNKVGDHDYYFVDGLMVAGANGTADGSGKLIISRLAEKDDLNKDMPRKNTQFNSVSRITVNAPSGLGTPKIYYSYHDTYNDSTGVFKGHSVKCTNNPCDVGGKNLDEILLLFDGAENKNSQGVSVVVKNSSGYEYYLYNSTDTYGQTISPAGIHLSAYQPDSSTANVVLAANNFPVHGNYYIIPVNATNMLVSAVSVGTDDANQLKIEHFTGDSRQKWAIDMINDPDNIGSTNFPGILNASGKKEYRIMELTRHKALNIYYDENYKMNFVSASETFNSLARNEPQIWNIFPLNDGTFGIKTVVPSFTLSEKSGFLFTKPAGEGPNNVGDVLIGVTRDQSANDRKTTPTQVERFILYSLDFSK